MRRLLNSICLCSSQNSFVCIKKKKKNRFTAHCGEQNLLFTWENIFATEFKKDPMSQREETTHKLGGCSILYSFYFSDSKHGDSSELNNWYA